MHAPKTGTRAQAIMNDLLLLLGSLMAMSMAAIVLLKRWKIMRRAKIRASYIKKSKPLVFIAVFGILISGIFLNKIMEHTLSVPESDYKRKMACHESGD